MISLINRLWTIKDIDTIIFDKDGTITDSHSYWGHIIQLRAQELIKQCALPTSIFPQLCLTMGFDIVTGKLIPEGPIALVGRDKVIEKVCEFLHTRGCSASITNVTTVFDDVHKKYKDTFIEHTQLCKGIKKFIVALYNSGVKLAIVTSDSVESTNEILDYYDLKQYFNVVIGRESTKEAKETGKPCKSAIKLLGSDPNHTITIGDAPVDITMGKLCGVVAGIGVCTGQMKKEELLMCSVCVVDTVNEIEIRGEECK